MILTPHPRNRIDSKRRKKKKRKKEEEEKKKEVMENNKGRSASANGRLAPKTNNNQLFSGNE